LYPTYFLGPSTLYKDFLGGNFNFIKYKKSI